MEMAKHQLSSPRIRNVLAHLQFEFASKLRYLLELVTEHRGGKQLLLCVCVCACVLKLPGQCNLG